MSYTKTIGNDRLGSGGKMKVDLKSYERSTHNLSYVWRSTMAAGTLVPFMKELALPGDTFDIDLDVDIKTHPTIGPLFGSYKVQLDVFQAPVRLYHSALHNNAIGIGMKMNTVKLPKLKLYAVPVSNSLDNVDNAHTSPSSLLAYLDIRGIGKRTAGQTNNTYRHFNAIPYIAYWDIYKNYYANKQEEVGMCLWTDPSRADLVATGETYSGSTVTAFPEGYNSISNNPFTLTKGRPNGLEYEITAGFAEQIVVQTNKGEYSLAELFNEVIITGTTTLSVSAKSVKQNCEVLGWWGDNWEMGKDVPEIVDFPLKNIDDMRTKILATVPTGEVIIGYQDQLPYNLPFLFNTIGGKTLANTDRFATVAGQCGLGLKTYQSDLFNNWMSTEWIDGDNGINAITAVDTSEGSFTIDQLQLSKKVYDMLNRIAISGGTYDDWLDAVYTHDRYRSAESPIYEGGLQTSVMFQEVISNSESGAPGQEQPLGTLAGRGINGGQQKGGKLVVKVDEPSYILGIASITPRIDYSQGNKWDVNLETMDDFHKPALDQIGFQDLITDQMAWYDTVNDNNTKVYKSAGKQPAWINYMTNVNVVRGNFAIEDNEMFMTLNRKYERNTSGNIKDLTTYIDPRKFNNIFAMSNRDAQNFWVQIGIDITARRKMSAKVMPNL